MLSGYISKKYGFEGLKENSIHLKFKGTTGQAFGAWLCNGVLFEVEGEANDYVGKGLSGGNIVVYPPNNAELLDRIVQLLLEIQFYTVQFQENAFLEGLQEKDLLLETLVLLL